MGAEAVVRAEAEVKCFSASGRATSNRKRFREHAFVTIRGRI
jgi:hypothetical protein